MSNVPDPPRAAVYVRLSRETEETTSPVRQRTTCERLLAERGYDYDAGADLFEDLDVSAYSGQRRPAFERLLAHLDRYDAVVFWRLDRVARSTVAFGQILERCDKAATSLISATEPFDTSSPIGEAMAWIIMVFAQLESRTIGVRVRSAQEHLVAHGRRRGGRRPFGWMIGGGGRLELHPTEAPVLRAGIADVLAGMSVTELSRRWNQQGIATSRGNLWDRSTLLDLLRRPLLAGHVTYRSQVVTDETGEPAVVNELLIDEWTWRRLQATLDGRRREVRRRDESLLGGLGHCIECGSPMWGSSTSYGCKGRQVRGPEFCPGNSIRRAFLDEAAEEWLAAKLGQPGFLKERRRAAELARQTPDPTAARAAHLRSALDRLETDRLEGRYDDTEGLARFTRHHRNLTAELSAIVERVGASPAQDLDELLASVKPTLEGIRSLDPARRRSLARLLIERVEVRKGSQRTGGKRDISRFRIVPRE